MDSLRAIEVVRTKRAKQQQQEHHPSKQQLQEHHLSKQQLQEHHPNNKLKYSSLPSPSPAQQLLADAAAVPPMPRVPQPIGSKAPSPLPPLPPPPLPPPLPHHHLLSPDSTLPPPPSPPCTCGKVLADMGPPPDWDRRASLESCFTAASASDGKGGGGGGTLDSGRWSQGYVSMTSAAASTYLIDATGAEPILMPAHPDLYCYPPEASQAPPPCSNGGYRQQKLLQRMGPDNSYGGQEMPPSAMAMSRATVSERHAPLPPLEDRITTERSVSGGGYVSAGGKSNGRTPHHQAGPSLGRPLSGQCNHLSDGCECFRENFPLPLHRKVTRN
jgi:hypothetical protein